MKRYFFLGIVGFLIVISGIPIVNGAEKNEYLSPFTHSGFYLSLKEGFNLNWEFETYNNSFQATVRIDDSEGYFIYLATAEVEGSGVYIIPKDDSYYITLWNNDPSFIAGYIRFTYNEPPLSISSFIPLILIGIITITVFIRGISVVKGRRKF